MKDSKLERQIANVERFIEGWRVLGEIVSSGEKVPDEELLRRKEELASLHGLIVVSLGIEEKRCLEFLEGIGKSSQGGELRRLQDSWHSCLIFMDEIHGRLEGRRSELAAVSSFQVASRTVFSNPFVRLVALFLCILLLHCIIKIFVIR